MGESVKFTQLPGAVDIEFLQGDSFTFQLDFNLDLTGYTFEAAIVLGDGTGTEVAMTVTPVDLAAGQIEVQLSAALSETVPRGINSWYLRWTVGAEVQTILAGDATVD